MNKLLELQTIYRGKFSSEITMNIVIVAGEVSGDLLGGKLIHALNNNHSELSISGIGGQTMRDAGMNTLFDVSETSVVGIVEIIKHYPRLRKILSLIKSHVKTSQPSLLILIDYPEFNLKLAKYAKTLGIKVLFYVSPQVWAWRTERVNKIKACVDLMAVLFPFELEFYQQAGVPACLVRHPLLEDVDRQYQITHSILRPYTIGLFPGSRKNEVKKLLPVMIEAANKLQTEYNDIKFILPVAQGVDLHHLKTYNTHNLTIDYQQDNFYQSISQCDIIIAASGTATLQCALMGKPMIVVYKISPITYKLFGHMVNVAHICIANIILNRRAYPELIQENANATLLSDELNNLIADQEVQIKSMANRDELYEKLNSGIDSDRLARKALSLAKN